MSLERSLLLKILYYHAGNVEVLKVIAQKQKKLLYQEAEDGKAFDLLHS